MMRRLIFHRWGSRLVSSPVEVNVVDTVASVLLSRAENRNALGRDMLKSLRAAINDIRTDRNIRAVVFRSTIPKVFCAGADLKERLKMSDTEVAEFVSSLRESFSEIEMLPQPTIAAIDGAALGGGLELALACDIRVGGQGALLGLVETKLGIIPGAGGTQRLPRLIGASKAKELIFTGRRLDALTAFNLGILNHCVSEGSALEKSMEIAQEIALSAPIAVALAKKAIDKGIDHDIGTGMFIEQMSYNAIIRTEDRLEGIRAFAEKRQPQYKGR